ncbi:hypothetical protein [Salinibacter altiplanensis]|uniref:hypothetical protein n=1 Tax=Salinibacter altiplanensis TaxID=1803181 RepID=UPI000C9FAC17|nr:hypothetical protein [Salinibacter altiplanensis]
MPNGESSVETVIRTVKGTKVADAIWCTAERWAEIKDVYDVPVASEMCAEEGQITFYDAKGEREASQRVLSFPSRIEA